MHFPFEVIYVVLEYCDLRTFTLSNCICKGYYAFVNLTYNSNAMWRDRFVRHFFDDSSLRDKSSLSLLNRDFEQSKNNKGFWKNLFKEYYQMKHKFKVIQTLRTSDEIWEMQWSCNNMLVSVGKSEDIEIFQFDEKSTRSLSLLKKLKSDESVAFAKFSPDCKYLFYVQENGNIFLHRMCDSPSKVRLVCTSISDNSFYFLNNDYIFLSFRHTRNTDTFAIVKISDILTAITDDDMVTASITINCGKAFIHHMRLEEVGKKSALILGSSKNLNEDWKDRGLANTIYIFPVPKLSNFNTEKSQTSNNKKNMGVVNNLLRKATNNLTSSNIESFHRNECYDKNTEVKLSDLKTLKLDIIIGFSRFIGNKIYLNGRKYHDDESDRTKSAISQEMCTLIVNVDTQSIIGKYFPFRSCVNQEVYIICIDIYGDYILSGSEDRSIYLWSEKYNFLIKKFDGHNSIVNTCKFHKSRKYFCSGSDDKTIKLWALCE